MVDDEVCARLAALVVGLVTSVSVAAPPGVTPPSRVVPPAAGLFPKASAQPPRPTIWFEPSGARRVRLATRVPHETAASSVLVCQSEVVRLGRFIAERSEPVAPELGGGEVRRFEYEAPCEAPSLLLSAPEVHPGRFLPVKASTSRGRVTPSTDQSSQNDVACTLTRRGVTQTVAGLWGKCRVAMAGDVNGDGVPDFVIEHMIEDPCLSRTLMLSSDGGWVPFASGTSFCPD
jgi:hypothetical protein